MVLIQLVIALGRFLCPGLKLKTLRGTIHVTDVISFYISEYGLATTMAVWVLHS